MPDGGLINELLPGVAGPIGRVPLVKMPTLHLGQERAFWKPGRHKAIRCGRRWGKTAFGSTIGVDSALKGEYVGFFAPDYKRLSETYSEIATMLDEMITQSSQTAGMIKCRSGGQIEFWTLEDENAGRSRKYHKVIIDEAAFGKKNVTDIWERSIEPTLFDYSGRALVLSNTNGIDEDNFFWRICNLPKYGFAQYHAPIHDNPLIPMRLPGEAYEAWQARREAEFKKLLDSKPPLVYQQEYLAEFVDWSGASFFAKDKLLDQHTGQPVGMPTICDAVFAVIDSATKTGKEHDGTAVTFFAVNRRFANAAPLTIVDWDIQQIEGALLEAWLPSIFKRLEDLARETGARSGSVGVFIEDKASGMILLQQAARRQWPVHAIDSKLTSLGKNERAINVSGYVYQGQVKIAQPAYDKVVVYKEISRNHQLSQVLGFRVNDNDRDREDDLLDTFCYGIALALGNAEGF